MTVGNICQRKVDMADELESVQTAAQRMGSRNVGTLIVTNGRAQPVGILTDRDVALRVVGRGRDPFATCVGSVMTTDPETIAEDVSVEEALHKMRARGVRRLPVTDEHGACKGVISVDDILRHLAQEFTSLNRVLEISTPDQA